MRSTVLTMVACSVLAGCADLISFGPQPDLATPEVALQAAPAVGSDIVIVLASDGYFGPSMAQAEISARYYCTTHGKMAELLSRQRPPEMRDPIFAEYSVLTYRCYNPIQKSDVR